MDDVYGVFGAPADLMAPRSWANDELAAVAKARRELIQSGLTEIPPAVPRGYVLSGKTESGAALRMFLGGVAGTLVGYFAATVASGIADLVVDFFNEVGAVLVPFLALALAVHFLAPLIIPFVAAAAIGAAAKSAKCRNADLSQRAGWLVSPLAVAATLWVARGIGEMTPLYQTMMEGLEGSMLGLTVGLPTALAFQLAAAKGGWIFFSLLGLLALLLTPALGGDAIDKPFCEESGAWCEGRIVGRYPIDQLGRALMGLSMGNGGALQQLESLPLDQKVDDSQARLDLHFQQPGSREQSGGAHRPLLPGWEEPREATPLQRNVQSDPVRGPRWRPRNHPRARTGRMTGPATGLVTDQPGRETKTDWHGNSSAAAPQAADFDPVSNGVRSWVEKDFRA